MSEIKKEVNKVVNVYMEKGIVTREEVKSIDLRSFGRELEDKMKKRGFPEAVYREFNLEDYMDYSGVLYDPNIFSSDEVEKHMIENVLGN